MSAVRQLAATVLPLLMAVPGVALARAIPGYLGSPYVPADASCFSNYYGSARNNCSTTKMWCMEAVVDPVGNYPVTVWAYAPNATANVGCSSAGVNTDISSVWTSGMVYVPSFGGTRAITLTGAYVPAGGQLYICCNVGPGGGVNGINY